MKVILEAQQLCVPEPRGVAYYSVQLIQHLLKRKMNSYELTFFDMNREKNNRQWIDKHFSDFNCPIHECNTLNYRDTWFTTDMYNEKSYNDYTGANGDIFHFMHLASVPRKLTGNMVVTIHDLLHFKYPEYYTSYGVDMMKLNCETVNIMNPVVITDSIAAKEDILFYTNVSEERVFVIPISFDEKTCMLPNNPYLLQLEGINKPYLLFLCAIAKNKNLSRVIEAFEIIAEKFPEITLVVAGGKAALPDTDAISKIENSHFVSRIKVIGYVSDELKHTLYSNALVFLYPSLFEGFGIPVIEAMARSCPVITSNCSSLPEVAGDAAILVDPYNVEQLAYEIERIITSEALQKELRIKGLEQSKLFSWNKTAKMTEDVYFFT